MNEPLERTVAMDFEPEETTNSDFAAPEPTRGPRPHPLERLSQWLGVFIAVAVLICVAVIAVPYLASGSGKARNPLDWWLRFGGARSDQTFDKFLRDSSQDYQRQWDENFRNSPMYQFDPSQMNWQFNTTPQRK